MYGRMGILKTHPGQREALLGYLLQATDILREMDGCYLYVISNATEDPDTVWITEVWRSQADHQASLAHETIRSIINAALPLLTATPEGFEIAPVGGVGVPDGANR